MIDLSNFPKDYFKNGLSESEAQQNLEKYGKNKLPESKKEDNFTKIPCAIRKLSNYYFNFCKYYFNDFWRVS